MKRALALFGMFALSCSGGFPTTGAQKRIVITRTSGDPGSPAARIPITFSTGPTFNFHIEVRKPDGSIDDGFNGWVRLSAKPGTVLPVQRNVHVQNGVLDNVPVTVIASYGDTRVWAEDVGYVPAAAGQMAQCANGKDDNNNYLVDFPADPGCFAPDDDDENPGTTATGSSDILYFARPRVADVRGAAENNGTGTAFPHEQVRLDTGYDAQQNTFAFDVVVTRIASDGFYVTDVQDQNARGYASVFAFTFSPPQRLGICDRLRALSGTASDFFGFTEIGFPTWSVEFYNPSKPTRPCLVPDPRVLGPSEVTDPSVLFRYESALVRVQAGGNVSLRIGRHFGPDKVPNMNGMFAPQDNASNCDLNGNGKVEFSLADEAACSSACTADVECSEYTNFKSQSNFTLVINDAMAMTNAKVQVDAAASPSFDPVLSKNKALGAFTGTLRYFSGGQQFTIQARCGDDIIEDPMGQPMPTDKACIRPRADLDLNEGTR